MGSTMRSHKEMSLTLDDYMDIDGIYHCALCGKHTNRNDSLQLVDINLKPSRWHCECYASFTAYNRSKCWDTYGDMKRIQDQEPDGFVKVITTLMKVIRAEEQQRRACQPIQLTC